MRMALSAARVCRIPRSAVPSACRSVLRNTLLHAHTPAHTRTQARHLWSLSHLLLALQGRGSAAVPGGPPPSANLPPLNATGLRAAADSTYRFITSHMATPLPPNGARVCMCVCVCCAW
jgi:hypothetical protein